MQTTEKDEDRRTRIWRMGMVISTLLILIVAVYFLSKGFLGNPVEGKWKHDESSLTLDIRKDHKVILSTDEIADGKTVVIDLDYTLNKKGKQITFKAEQESFDRAVKELGGNFTEAQIRSSIDSLLTSFSYSLENSELTLTEWDYGEQYIFNRVR